MTNIRAAGKGDVKLIKEMAEIAFRDTYKTILTPDQTEYMMDMMYAPKNIEAQMDSGHAYFICEDDGVACAYISVEKQGESLFHLQKIYILPQFKGRGIGRIMFERAVRFVRENGVGICKMELNVNRTNKAVDFYKHMGMCKSREGDFDIGGGYFMNDFIMSLDIPAAK